MLNNTTITVNMGHSFKLIPGKPLYFGSAKLSPSDYSVEGDKLIIHSNKDVAQSLGSAPTITFSAQYTNTQSIDKNITLGVSLSGKNDGDGMVYQYNNKEVPAQQGGIPTIHSYKTQIVVSQVVSNQCIHSATDLSNGEVQLQDQVLNNNLKSKTYYIAGEIPIAGSNNLPGNDGEPSTGGLSSELQTLNTGGAPTWVLPKSAMNSENEKILTTPNGNDLKGSLKYIESPNSGWIKYKPGMNLNNMIGYFTAPTVGPRDEFNMTYNVKLKQGDNPDGLPEVVNSAFKYYDVTDNIGSTSNIVNITTPGTDLSNNWISTVKEVDGGKLTQQDLDKTVTINGKIVSLKDFIGTGPDLDANYDNTPTKLMNEVTLSQDKEALAKLGYQLVNITVNGKVRDLSWFENTGIAHNTGLTEVIFNIKKIAPTVTKADTTVTENYSNGRPVVQSVTTSNAVGSKVNAGLPTLPEGYKVIKVTVNGKVVPQDEVPTTQSKDNQTIVYTIGKIPTYKDIVKVVDSKGNQVGNIETATGETGKETGLKVPEIPKGYHVVSITNGNGEKVNGVPTTFGDSDNTTIYHIEKDITDKVYVDVKTETGTIITPSHEVASGAPGSKISVEMPNIPSEYHIEKVLVNGKVIKPDAKGQYELPNTLSNNTNTEVDDHIEVIVAKTPTTTVEEKYQDGTSVVPNKTTVNLQGTKVNTGLPELPSGYKVIKVTVNGQEVPESEVPTVQSAKDQTIVYTIGKVSTDTVKVVDESNNQIGSTVSKTGVSGTETGLKTPTIPNGYHIVNVTDNGKVITTGVPSKFTDNNQNIVYHIAKDVTTTVKEVYSNGESVTPSVTTTNDIGAKVNTGLPELPKGYQVVKVTVNGQEVTQSEVPSTQGSKDQVIIYTIGKQPTDTIKVINEKGIQVGKTVSVTGDTGSKTGLEVPTIPNGYHIVSETINGKAGTGVPNTFGDSDTNIIYNIAPNVKDETYGSIVTDSGKILVPVTPLNQGEPGTKATVQMPNIPKGYKIVKVTINNGEVPISSNGKYEVTYDNNVSKEVDNKIVITVKHIPVQDTIKVMEGSKIVSTTKTKEGMPGEDTGIQTPNIPNGYHIDKITVDGNTVTNVPKTFGDSNQTIIYHLTENKVNDIKADVVTESGQPLVNNTTVAEGPEGSDVTCNKTEIPEGYHLVKVEYNGKVISSTTGGKVIYMLPDTIPTGKAGQLTYVVAKNTSTVNIKVVGGPEPYSHTTSGTVGSNITGETPIIPKGYKVTNITVNGHTVSEKDLPKTYGNKTYNIVYHVTKIPTGDIQQTVVTTDGTVIEKPTVVASGEVGNSITVKPYTPPEGYHIVKVEIDGKELTTQEEKDLIHNLPNTINSPKTEVVKYVIAKDTTPSVAQKGTIIIKVVDQQNISVVPEKTYTGTVGDKTPNMVPTIPNGDTLQKITSGQVTPVSGLPDTFSPGVHIYVYHVIEHKGSLTYTINVNGQPIRREYLTGVDGQTASYGLPHNKDWKLENIIVDGKKIPVDGNSDYHGVYSEDGTQVIYNYKTVTPNVTPQPTKPVKPEHKDTPIVKPNKGDNTPSGDVNHNGGNTTPSQSGDKENTPNKGDNTPSKGGNTTPSHDSGDHTPSKPSKGDNTPSGDINHNGGNTTPSQSGDKGNTPNKGDNTPSKGGNTTPSHDSGDHTPSKPSKGDNTPSGDINHNGGNTTPSQSGDKGNTPNKGDNTPSKGGNTTPSHDSGDHTSSKPSKGDNTPSGDINHNGGNTTPSQSGDKGNTPNKGDNTPSKGGNTTPSHDSRDHTSSKPSKGDNTPSKGGNTTPSHDNGDHTPSKPSKGDNTPSGDINHNGGNTTPSQSGDKGNTPNKGDNTPSKGGNTTPSHDSGDHTPSKPSKGDNTPSGDINHNGGNTTPSQSGDKGNTPNKGDNTPSKGGNTTPSHDSGDHTPSKPSKGDNTPSGDINHNGGNTTPSQSGDKGNTPNKGDNTPSKGGNTTPSHDSGDHTSSKPSKGDNTPSKGGNTTPSHDSGDHTPSKPSKGDNTPSGDINHNGGNTTPSQSGDKGNTPNKGDNTPSKGGNTTPSHDSGDHTPSKPSKGDNTPSGDINHNGGNTTPSQSGDKGNTPNKGDNTPSKGGNTTPSHDSGDHTSSKPSKGDNTPSKGGNTTPSHDSGDHTPSKPSKGDNTPSGDINHNGGNTTPSQSGDKGNTPNKGDNTPSKGGNTTPSHDSGDHTSSKPSKGDNTPSKGGNTTPSHDNGDHTPSKPSKGDNTPSGDINHNGGNTTPSQSGDKGNTPNKGDNTPSKGGNTTPSHDSGDHTPSKPSKGDNTPSGDINHNGGNTTPSQSGDKGNTPNKGDNTPSKGGNTTPSHDSGDHTPSKPSKGDNTPSGDINHNGGNTTPSQSGDKGNTPNKGDNTPSKGGNTTPSHDSGDHTSSKPSKGDNTPSKGGNTTPSHDNGDHTPSKPSKGDNTPSGDINHNGGNTTPSQSGDKGNTPNKGDNTPSKGGNTTPSHDSGDHTPSKPSKGDNTPSGDINHNGGNTTPSQSGDKGNTPNKGDNTPSKGGNTTPSHDSGDHTPSKPSKGDNTPSGDINHNGGNTTPSQSGDKGNTPNKGDNTPSKGGNTTPSHDSGDHTSSKPSKGDNTPSKGGNTTPSHDSGDHTPSKPSKGDNTPSGDINHNGGNTTPSQSGDKGNTPNKGDNTPSKGGNTTPSHDSGDHTPSKPSKGDNTPSGDINHNGGNTTPSQSGDKGNTPNKGDNTPSKGGNTTPSHDSGDHTSSKPSKGDNTPSKGGNTTPSHDNGDHTPSKPSKGDNTPSGDINHNGGNTTPSQSGDKGNTPNKGDNTPSKGGNTTPSHDSGDHTPSKPSKGDNTPSGDINHNGGNTTPSQSGDKENTPNKGDNTPSKGGNTTPSHDNGDHTPSKPSKGDNTPNKGDNTPSGDVNHNGGNTTPSQGGDKGNTPNKGDNTPSGNKDANNGGSTKTSTSTHTEVTGGGEAHSTGTAHATVNGSGSSTSTSSSSVTGGNNNSTGTSSNTTPNVVSGGNTVTPHVVVNTTSSNRSDSNGITPTVSNNTTTSNGNDTTPFNSSSVSSSAGSTYTDNNLVNGPNEDDSTAQTVLPHTGLSTQNVENTAEQAGALAGIMAMLGGVFFFRRKK